MAVPLIKFNTWKTFICSLCYRRFYATEKRINTRKKQATFLDKLRVHVRGGAGGQGLAKHGGVGGNGGNIIMIAKRTETLLGLANRFPEKRFTASTGGNSRKHHLLGEDGEDLTIHVPIGIILRNDSGKVIGELNEHGQEVIAAHGGRGGNSKNRFLGLKGETFDLTLDLKLLADIGLVGFPNAGKSTFLSAVSRAKPKIADYPFTTIRPQIGTMTFSDGRQITVADLPGLIEGAHINFGMGHKFLKHIERTKLLLFMIDVNGFQLAYKYQHRTPFETIILLIKELELYRADLMTKPAVLAINKCDIEGSQQELDEVQRLLKQLPDSLQSVDPEMRPSKLIKFQDVFMISAKTGEAVLNMKGRLRQLLDTFADLEHSDNTSKSRQIVPVDDEFESVDSRFQEQATSKLV